MIARVLLVLSLMLLCAAPAEVCAAPDVIDALILDEDPVRSEIFAPDAARPSRASAAKCHTESPPLGPPAGRVFRPPRA